MANLAPDPAVVARHRIVLAAAFVVALVLTVTASEHGHGSVVTGLSICTLVPALGVTLAPRPSHILLAAGAAATLFGQTVLASVEFGEGAHPASLLLATLAVVAVYRDSAALLVTAIVVAIGQIVLTFLGTDPLETTAMEAAQGTGSTVVSVTAAVLGAWGLVVVWRDHRQAERTAAERDQVTAGYREIVPLVAIQLDRDGRLIDANRKTCLMLDREIEDILGEDWFDLALPEEYRESGREFFERAVRGEDPVVGPTGPNGLTLYTNEIVGADGVRRLVEWSSGWILDDDGGRASLIAVGRDMTDEHAAKQEAARARAEMDALRRLAQKIASLDDARQAVVDATLELTGASFAGIAEPDRQRQSLDIEVASNPDVLGLKVDLGTESSLVGQAFLSSRTVYTEDITKEPTHHPKLTPLLHSMSLVHQPIVGAHGTIGVMTVGWADHLGDRREHALELVRLVAHEAAIALRRRESLAALERAALIDPLTGVANRRAFDAELPSALRRAADSGKPLSLVVMDLNHFKEVNDTQGHEAGDHLLIDCSAAWIDVLRAGDMLARLGGDEFAVLLPSCDEIEMLQVIERVRAATPHGPGTSVGGATWDGVEGGSQFVRRADDAQYRDKALGRSLEEPPQARSRVADRAPRQDPRSGDAS